MVTLNFTMHREIAAMLEEAAYQQLKLLENKQLGLSYLFLLFLLIKTNFKRFYSSLNLGNSSENLTYLQSILQYFSDAAQSYMKV